jgi:hypothetical protein
MFGKHTACFIFVGIYEYLLNDDHGVLIRLFESCAYCGMPRLGAFYGYPFYVDHDVFSLGHDLLAL